MKSILLLLMRVLIFLNQIKIIIVQILTDKEQAEMKMNKKIFLLAFTVNNIINITTQIKTILLPNKRNNRKAQKVNKR